MKKSFGITKDGQEATLFSMENKRGMTVTVSDYGATLVSLLVPDSGGNLRDVVLGYDDVSGYESGGAFFGAIVGRNANRIKNASFKLNGNTYTLDKNDNENNLHSGNDFYCKRLWKAEAADEMQTVFSLLSPDGDQGYPGELCIRVTYSLTDENELYIQYEAKAQEDTIVNLTNHSYFNLDGHDSGDVLRQKAWIDAAFFTRADAESIPTGELLPVINTPMDFTSPKAIGQEIADSYEAVKLGNGYDHNWVLNGTGKRKAAALSSCESGITMEVWTDLPGIQFYTGNFIEREMGKNSCVYQKRQGVCFETQYFPDAVNQPSFKVPKVNAGTVFKTETMFKFL